MPEETPQPDTRHACPMCGQPSIYSRREDRYFHIDGTDNRGCWVGMLRSPR